MTILRTYQLTPQQEGWASLWAMLSGTAVVWADAMTPRLVELFAATTDPGFRKFMLPAVFGIFPLMLFIATLLTLPVGGPIYLLLKKFVGVNLISLLALGPVAGASAAVIWINIGGISNSFWPHLLFMGIIAGLVGAVAFYGSVVTSNYRIERTREQ